MITIENNRNSEYSACPVCYRDTPSYPSKVFGFGNVLWCFLCFACVGPFSVLFLCMDQLGDTELKCSRCQTIPSPKRTWVSCPHPGWDYEASHPKEQSSDALGARACSGTDCLPFPEMALEVILETVSFTQYLGVCGTHKSKI